jgi:AraC-like DNA-binding protein
LALLKKRDMAILKNDKPRGVLNSRRTLPNVRHARYAPATQLAPFVEHYWTVEWNLVESTVVQTLPHPSVHIVFEPGLAQLAGVATARFQRQLKGNSRVFGVKFRPGGFRPFIDQPVSAYSERTVELCTVFGADAQQLGEQVLQHADHHASIEVIEAALRARQPVIDAAAEFVGAVVDFIAVNRRIIKVEQLVEEFDVGLRQLQRLFDDYVGVGPKWVIQRYRLHELAERIAEVRAPDWADMAAELGYADQSHLIRDFKRLVGMSPLEYLQSLAPLRS